MARQTRHVLLTWELGDSFGHIARCQQLARSLSAREVRVTMVFKDICLPTPLTCADPVQIIQAPATSEPPVAMAPRNHAELMLACGFGQVESLAARLRAWLSMLSLLAPDVVVADHAPTALLAAHVAGLPRVVLGNGFSAPPAQHPWPPFTTWHQAPEATLIEAEKCVDQHIAQALRSLGCTHSAPASRSLYDAPLLLDTHPELDHYPARPPGAHYVGPLTELPGSLAASWTRPSGAKVLAYLHRRTAGLPTILRALASLNAEVICVVPHPPGSSTDAMPAHDNVRLHTRPLHFPSLLPQATLAISNGNGGFSTQSLRAGVPLAMYPRHTEQGLMSMAIERLGAGQIVADALCVERTRDLLLHMMSTPAYTHHAQAFAQRYLSHSGEDAVNQSTEFILRTIG